ncbi:thiosulfate:glutathione sulfurtransferase-like isoform X3 [Branchiostoma floridae]|uniref:Thiosulfate:glutathione sulfurtransferase-like isoform X3 n=1 Tax=Branchiostoma floridae TaxID=7739 RepID=A0A9J7HNX1_BRAFL|nr:thiosulfate:glutathione sulfurtransferase-like isoform X3 [Branchiostoma floridae]
MSVSQKRSPALVSFPGPSTFPWGGYTRLLITCRTRLFRTSTRDRSPRSGTIISSCMDRTLTVSEPVQLWNSYISGGLSMNRLHIDLKMPEEDFKEKYGVEKPGKDNLILHCLGGIRSRGALAIAHALGYEKARHYIGGYAEWAAKQQS